MIIRWNKNKIFIDISILIRFYWTLTFIFNKSYAILLRCTMTAFLVFSVAYSSRSSGFEFLAFSLWCKSVWGILGCTENLRRSAQWKQQEQNAARFPSSHINPVLVARSLLIPSRFLPLFASAKASCCGKRARVNVAHVFVRRERRCSPVRNLRWIFCLTWIERKREITLIFF